MEYMLSDLTERVLKILKLRVYGEKGLLEALVLKFGFIYTLGMIASDSF
jgi:hypothetical protein